MFALLWHQLLSKDPRPPHWKPTLEVLLNAWQPKRAETFTFLQLGSFNMLSYFKRGCFGNNWIMSCRKNVHCGDLSVQPVKLHARHYDSLNSSMLADAASIISIIRSTCHECLSPVFFLTADSADWISPILQNILRSTCSLPMLGTSASPQVVPTPSALPAYVMFLHVITIY